MTMTRDTRDPVWLLCHAHGLPLPEREVKFHPTRDWRADYLWRDARVILEVDGGIWAGRRSHASAAGILRDMEKGNAAQLLGYRFLRVTPHDVRSGAVLTLLRTALDPAVSIGDLWQALKG